MGWCRRHSYLLAVLAITLLAAVVRIYRIESFPPGLHGDEAWTGLDARRVLDEGWIGPYVASALGQPSGPLYWTAAVFKVLGDGAAAAAPVDGAAGHRDRAADLLGRAPDVRPAYGAGRGGADCVHGLAHLVQPHGVHGDGPTAARGHLPRHCCSALTSATATPLRAAGAALGLGVYTYNAYPVFVGATVVFAVVLLVVERKRWQTLAPRLGLMFIVAFVVALPLISYIRDEKNDYLAHHA